VLTEFIEQYALTSAGFTITKILQKYKKIEAVHPSEYVDISASLTMSPRKCEVRMYRA
jgi:hypothetical protein